MDNIKLSKFISHCSISSRRDAKELVQNGDIYINKKPVNNANYLVKKDDLVEMKDSFDNLRRISIPEPKIWLYNKPAKMIVSHKDKRTTIFDDISRMLPDQHLISVGRLDYMSSGLMIITNSPEFAHGLETSTEKRVYIVEIKSKRGISNDEIKIMSKGVNIFGMKYKPIFTSVIYGKLKSNSKNNLNKNIHQTLKMTLHEGKNREIRNILAYFHCYVKKLHRIEYGSFKLGKLKPSELTKAS